jgi:hypothetical protein
MSSEYPSNMMVQLGYFQGDAPEEIIALWHSHLKVPIKVHEAANIGVKTYLINEFPEGFNSITYSDHLSTLGLEGIQAVILIENEKLRKGWNNYIAIGPEVAVIPAPVV